MRPIAPILLALLALAGCGRKAPTAAEAATAKAAALPPQVKLARVEDRTVERKISITGTLLPDESVNLAFEVAGTLARTYTDFGKPVKQGQVVAELDRREFQLQLDRSRAGLAQALARVGLLPDQVDTRPDSTPAIRQAQAQADDAKSKLDSAERLVATGDISRERYVELEKAYRARDAAVQATRDELRTQLAGVQGLRADVRLAEKRMSDTYLRAPFDGAVIARMVSPGQFIRENTPVLTIVKPSPLRLRADIPESAVSEVKIGTTLTFNTDAAPNEVFHAVIRELNPALDAKSRSLAVEGRLVERTANLKPGMFVQVQLVVARAAHVVAVPKDALYAVAGLTKVFAIRDGMVAEYKVEPQQELEGWVVIPDVLKAGEQVAVSNLDVLVQGMKVQAGG